ncbi:MAG: phosphoglucomutase 2 [Trebouxia sp. A1-2]|nr:MAG: phosphoglucomutase 2 [Trebouxia sp. A1-2]
MAMQAQISQQVTSGPCRLRSPGPQACSYCIKQHVQKARLKFSVAALSPSLQQRCDEWLALDTDFNTVSEASQAIDTENEALLQDCLGQRLAFGTAGLRGIMGFGFNRMNQVVVQQTTQGFCKYLQEQAGPKLATQGVAIGYDGRHHSKEFAHLAAAVFVSQNVRVHLFSEVVPTPFVAGAVTYKGCAGGIMITASHNPKQYNGYKVYWGNGCQIIPPHDVGIAAAIDAQTELWDLPSDVTSSELVKDPLHMVTQRYYYALQQDLSFRPRQDNCKAAPVVYTPLHGVGLPWVQKALPDPDFPTLTFPNPEEGPGVLDLAFATARAHGAKLVLANDPDADRFAAAEQDPQTGAWRIFSGNEIGILLAHWLWCCWRRDHMDNDPACVVMLASAVSSKMLQAMAQEERFKFDETLTGFKWLGHRALELQQAGFTPLFAFEEAIGFMFAGAPGSIKDKDGSSCCLC